MKRKEIHPAAAGAVIAIVVVIAVYVIYSGTSQKMSSFDHAKMREYAGKAGMSVPNGGASSGGSSPNTAR